ncbi:MAG: lipoprotein [Bacteroidetes bacterium]|nr:MAG: lipoprotein [Bacteroidota bacterium]
MKKIYLLLLIFHVAFVVKSQGLFHKFYQQDNALGLLYRCAQTDNGGYISVGNVTDESTFSGDFLIVRANPDGSASWCKSLTLTDNEQFTDVVESAPGEFVVVGSVFSTTTFTSQIIVAKYNDSGSKIWCKMYSVNGSTVSANRIQKDETGNIYILGMAEVAGASSDYLIMKLDGNGNILQQSTIGTPVSDYPLSFLRNAQGDLFIGGWANSGTGETIHMIRLNASMELQWDSYLSGNARYFNYDMKEKSSGNIVIAGRYDNMNDSYDVLLAELDVQTGTPVWIKSYSASDGTASYAYGLAVGENDHIGVTGIIEGTLAGTLLFETDQDGVVNWSERISGTNETDAHGYGICPDSDGGYVVCGKRSGDDNSVVQLLKSSNTGEVTCSTTDFPFNVTDLTPEIQHLTLTMNTGTLFAQDITLEEMMVTNFSDACIETSVRSLNGNQLFDLYPNPSDGIIQVNLKEPTAGNCKVDLFDAQGILVSSGEMSHAVSGPYKIPLEIPGIYFIRITNGNRSYTGKVINF